MPYKSLAQKKFVAAAAKPKPKMEPKPKKPKSFDDLRAILKEKLKK